MFFASFSTTRETLDVTHIPGSGEREVPFFRDRNWNNADFKIPAIKSATKRVALSHQEFLCTSRVENIVNSALINEL